MTAGDDIVSTIHSAVLEHLALLADPQAQREYERRVPIADVPAELVCGWFDDVFQPGDLVVQRAFDPRELAVLTKFNDLFDAALAELPEQLPRLSELQAHPAWLRVVSGASEALRSLSPRSA